jgi:hypothetical protein
VAATAKAHWAKLTGGSSVNATVDERDADMGGGAVYHDTRVEVVAVDVPVGQDLCRSSPRGVGEGVPLCGNPTGRVWGQ